MCKRPVGRSPVSMVYFSGCTARSALISSLIFLEARKVSLVKSLAMGADPLFLVRRFGVAASALKAREEPPNGGIVNMLG